MIASLPMYQRPQLVGAHDRYWNLIRNGLLQSGIDSPVDLAQHADEFATWTDPSLVLSQTCGMPYRNGLHRQVALVGTPDFGVDGCAPGFYRSAFIARRDDPRTRLEDFAYATFAYNQGQSQSGLSAAYHHVSELGFWFEHRLHTGQHLASAFAVAQGRADIAAIDAVTWRLIRDHESFATDLKVIDWTTPTPGLPYITRPGADTAALFAAVAHAIQALAVDDRLALGLRGIVEIPSRRYLQVPNPPSEIMAAL